MRSGLVLCSIIIVSVVSLSLANDDSIFSDPIISMEQNPVESSAWLFDQVTLPQDASTVNFGDETDNLFSSNPFLNVAPLEDSFQMADCSTEDLSVSGISRVRRDAGPRFCNSPSPATAAQPGLPEEGKTDMIDLQSLLRSGDVENNLKIHMDSERRNAFCYWYTQGRLPWGVCSTGKPADVTTSPGTQGWLESTVSHGTMSKSICS